MYTDKRKITPAELVKELEHQNLKKYDIVLPATSMRMQDGILVANLSQMNDDLTKALTNAGIVSENNLSLELLDTAHSNVAEKLGIPKRYYDKCNVPDNQAILDAQVNHWLDENGKNYMLRNFVDKDEQEGVCRAFLSDRFKPIDNFDVLIAVMEAIKEEGVVLQTEYCDITNKRMYVRFTNPNLIIESPELLKNYRVPDKGNTGNNGIVAGLILSNSEIGFSQFSLSPRAVVGACSNGITFYDDKFAKTHLGQRLEENSSIDWSEETKKKNKELIICQAKDALKYFMNEEYFSGKIFELEQKGKQKIENKIECVRNVTKALSINDAHEKEILNYFIEEGDFTAFGVTQAITYFAHKTADADTQFELEASVMPVIENIDKYDIPEKKTSVKTQSEQN